MKKRPDSAKGYLEESDPYRTKTRDGKTILCHACGLAASAVKKLRIIGCDVCNHHFHLECLDPPLVTPPPVTTKWVCPLHMDQTAIPNEPKVIPIDKPNTPNNGNIDVVLSPNERMKAKQIEYIRINGVKYQVPENIIILDFWDKLSKGKNIDDTETLDPNPVRENVTTTAPPSDKPLNTFSSPKTPSLATLTKPHSSRIECDASASSSRVSYDPPPVLPRASHSSSTKSAAKQSKLASLLQAAQTVNEIQKSVSDAGLILLGNAASLQSKVPSNSRPKPKKHKSSSKSVSSAPRTPTRDCTPLQSRGCNSLRAHGCNRSGKSISMCSEISDLKDSTNLKSPEDQTATSLNQPLAISPFNTTHVDLVPPNNQATSLDKMFSCQNPIIASPVHAGCQWTGPRHISLGPARSTIFMGRAGPGLYLKSLGPTHDPACGGPGSANGL